MSDLSAVLGIAELARSRFTQLLGRLTVGGATPKLYQRYLSMQYHLTRDVQRYFMVAAAHHEMARLRRLRRFLFDFANEEELHYVVAGNDLREAGLEVLPMPFDVELWHAYFGAEVQRRPFVRIGAAVVLENMAGEENRGGLKALLQAPFLNARNTKFLRLHMHEQLPHGQQIVDALQAEVLSVEQEAQLAEGARKGAVMYLRMAEWALDPQCLSALVDEAQHTGLSAVERQRIDTFRMDELDD